jgi:Aldehyde dehydrogenase family
MHKPRCASGAGATRRFAQRSPASGPTPVERRRPATYAPPAGRDQARQRCDAATEASTGPGKLSVPSHRRGQQGPRDGDRNRDMDRTEHAQTRLLIGGEWTDARSGQTYDRAFPFTGEQVGVASAAGREDVRAAVDSAREAFGEWSRSAPAMRRCILGKAADLLMQRQVEIAGIAPWNAPVILGTRAVASPLAYANTVVLKASEICPRTHAAIVHALQDAGLPPGVINLITNAPQDAADVVDELIAHPATRRINFTGSTKVGRIIAEKAGKHLTRVLLELGGKAPMVVLKDSDLDRAAGRRPARTEHRDRAADQQRRRRAGLCAGARTRSARAQECSAAANPTAPASPRRSFMASPRR